ncbi:MAG: hypothetical protein Q7K43_04685 [Candidatus Woesearchaeota archaeon]|nr:hypothetical protein [Candidatus Woesearchaeota archaeon]
MPRPCLHCKSLTHIDTSCPMYLRSLSILHTKSLLLKPDFSGVSPSPFIGRFGYPNVFVGALATPVQENKELLDSPKEWVAQDFSIGTIASLRSGLINARSVVDARHVDRILSVVKEIALASHPIDVDVRLKKLPAWKFSTDSHHAPMGPSVELQKLSLLSNPHIPTRVQKVVDDTDLLTSGGMQILHKHGVNEYSLSKMLSVGALGLGSQRRLVPTRWAITATDDMLAKQILAKVRLLPLVNESSVLCSNYLGNFYVIVLFPGIWQYELFEIMSKNAEQFSTDYENFAGRTHYAEQCAGGYYTVRLAVCEWLQEKKRQASVLVFRLITPEYDLPLGVWVTREAGRKAISAKPIKFSSQELALLFVSRLVQSKFSIKLSKFFKESRLLSGLQQKKLGEFT